MAWSFDSVGASGSGTPSSNRTNNVFRKATETLTVATSNSSGQDLTSSVIDFIPKGSDFLIIANSGQTNLSSGADLAMLASATSGGTYGLLKDDLSTEIDNLVVAMPYIANSGAGSASYGEAPFYKLFVDSDGVQKKTDTVVLNLFW